MPETAVATVTSPAVVEVSPEMTMLLGSGAFEGAPLPPEPLVLTFVWGQSPTAASLAIHAEHTGIAPAIEPGGSRLVLVIQKSAFERVGGRVPAAGTLSFHLPSELAAIAVALRDCPMQGEALKVYRLGKSIELLCETIRLERDGQLVPRGSDGSLSAADTRRILAARHIIDERWAEHLTLEGIARACGLNRAKLTSRFRELFKCTVAEAIAEKRLAEAGKMLLTTDLPVSSVGYRNGYQNNAAFSRAFSRRYGMPPSGFRMAAALQ